MKKTTKLAVSRKKGDGFAVLRNCRDDVLAVLSRGIASGRSLEDISTDRDMPPLHDLLQLVKSNEEFERAYLSALQARTLSEVSKILDIADTEDHVESVARSKLKIDTRMKLAERLLPKVFAKQTVKVEDSGSSELANVLRDAMRRSETSATVIPAEKNVTPEVKK